MSQEVPRWTWESLWCLGCPEHLPWLRSAADDDYETNLQMRVEEFRKAYDLVKRTIKIWDDIARIGDATLIEKLLSVDDFSNYTNTLKAEMHPEMEQFDPESLPDCLQRIKDDGIVLARELELARWQAPVSWNT